MKLLYHFPSQLFLHENHRLVFQQNAGAEGHSDIQPPAPADSRSDATFDKVLEDLRAQVASLPPEADTSLAGAAGNLGRFEDPAYRLTIQSRRLNVDTAGLNQDQQREAIQREFDAARALYVRLRGATGSLVIDRERDRNGDPIPNSPLALRRVDDGRTDVPSDDFFVQNRDFFARALGSPSGAKYSEMRT